MPARPPPRPLGPAALRLFAVLLPLISMPAFTGEPPTAPVSAAGSLRIALTIDDLPVAPPRHGLEQQVEITDRLLATLAEHRAPAVGFVNESKLEHDGRVEPRLVALLERWLDAGHELGNHGYAHLDLHRVEPELWLADVERGERVIRPLVEGRGGQLEWFRHPFLHTGRSEATQERTTAALAALGYRIAPVTIDNGEWIFGGAYADAWNAGDERLQARLGEAYVRYMLEAVEFYRRQALEIVGEPIPQVLLLHAYALNADWLGRLLGEFERRGAVWIRLEDALAHPAYARPTSGYIGQGGITWLHRWAITAGMPPAIFAGEPEVPAWVGELP